AGVTVRDLHSGQEYQTEYHYRDGYYDGAEKEFRGFGAVRKLEFGSPEAPTVKNLFTFDVGDSEESRKGLVLSSASLEENGTVSPPVGLFETADNELDTQQIAVGLNNEQVRFSYVSATTSNIYEGGTVPVSLYQEIEKDIYGNTTKEYQYGIVEGTDQAAGGDEILTDTAYDIDTDAWLVNLPKEMSSTTLDGSFIARKRLFYDEKGNLRREEGSPDGTTFLPLVRNEYDNYGNIILITDANEKCRNIDYDEQFHTFPIRESICGLNLLMEAEYDTGLGVLTEHTDFNQQVTQYDYDPLGRLTAIIRPGDTLALPTQNFAYQVGNPLSAVRTSLREQAGNTATYDSITYYDGLGRKLQARSEDNQGRWIVSNAVDFNLRRQPDRQWQPYFSSTAAYEPPDPTQPFTRLLYDAKARVREQVNPDSTVRRTEFAPLSRIEYDEEDMATGGLHANTPTRFFSDGLERLIRVEEQNGSQTYVTQYGYDGLNNLVHIKDNEQNIKTMSFDGLGRKQY
ncbi:MAG: hypothetical protein D3917_18870, partial [Candidatus Electrothrix sp. AX5]|nr:hypothetical protein [Candidatus Electrothrix sp. AX5]